VRAAEDAPIVVFGDDWGRHVSSIQHVFRAIAGRRRLVWVNAIGHRVPGLRDVRRAWEKGIAMLRPAQTAMAAANAGPRPNIIVQPRVLPWHQIGLVHRLNTRLLLRDIRAALAKLGGRGAPVLVTGSPPSAGVVGRLGERASLYFCMDDFLHLPGVTAWMIGPLEAELLRKVDALVATAESLTRSKVPRSGRVHYLPQGVNYDHFAAPRSEPADLAGLPHPRIGFAGGVSACVAFPLVERLAAAFPQGSIVLVGPVTTSLNGFAAPNVHVLGPRPYQDLPAYVQHFDVGIVPYLLNEWTLAVDPLKLLEYCAAGIPVVTTDIPEVRKYRDAVAVAGSDEAFVEEVRRAVARDRDAARRRGQALARGHTWAHRADELLAIIDDIAARRAAATVGAGTGARE
jgi:glycosyltransferase involved in cell wall biosynthesis